MLAEAFFTGGTTARRSEFDQFCREHLQAETYARFRAAAERHGPVWSQWPEPLRGGTLAPGDFEEPVARYHLYAQWQIESQLRALTEHAQANGLLWYLDFPLGVSGNGYDTWRERDVFAMGTAGGAPPDMYFTKGQNWGFPPLHPERLREQEYRYLITAIRRHLQYARVLRFDHVMGLYRLYWVPDGFPASQGVYVRYRAEELFAILTLESHRYQAEIVGENLGTVPETVNRLMRRHGVHTMYVVQYETRPQEDAALPPVSPTSVASLNTHDMPPFASFWQGLDIDGRVDLGLLTAEQAEDERQSRAAMRRAVAGFLRRQGFLGRNRRSVEAVFEAATAFLASSDAAVVLVNLEDLWGETHPQNTPGTWKERPNWRYKAKYRFEKFRELPVVLRVLRMVDECRRNGGRSSWAQPDNEVVAPGRRAQ
jgi:4-alpha-glucanotransferase